MGLIVSRYYISTPIKEKQELVRIQMRRRVENVQYSCTSYLVCRQHHEKDQHLYTPPYEVVFSLSLRLLTLSSGAKSSSNNTSGSQDRMSSPVLMASVFGTASMGTE
jgi:hypothetical protein